MLTTRLLSLSAALVICIVAITASSPARALTLRPATEGLVNEIDLESHHGWCTGGPCSYSTGNYHFASLEAYTFTPAHVNHRISAPDEATLRCEHAYSDARGVRHDDIAQVRAFVNDDGVPLHGSLGGTIGIPSPDSRRDSTNSTGFADVTVHDSGLVFGYDGKMHMMTAVGTANGIQTTDNTYRRGTLAGGMHITITGTLLKYHEVNGTNDQSWAFDGSPNTVTTCVTTNVPPGFQYDGNSVYDRGAH